jgi:UDP:flavonoid glycosyltransferase YjiC (YdhE family)
VGPCAAAELVLERIGGVRVLVTVNDAVGHLFPLVPTLTALAEAGADVLVACPGSVGEAVADRFTVRTVEPSEVEVPEFPAAADRQERFSFAVNRRWPNIARAWVSGLLGEVERWEPELVIAEPTEHAGRVVAAVLGVPSVEHGWGFTLPATTDAEATASISDLYSAFGASPRPTMLRVDLGPQRLQAADAAAASRFRYRPWSAPAAVRTLPERTRRRRILVTLGTFPNPDAAARLAAAARAAASTGAETIVVLGNRDISDHPWPHEAVIVPWVDTAREVARCDLVVHHAGAGTAYACLLAGVPAVCLPQMGDQFRNANLLAAAGVCLVSTPEDATETHVVALLEQALTDNRLATQAHQLCDQNALLPDVDDLADALLAVAA